jgi:aspartyl/asparaginyl beta-hydroxylase (cupin superfamily)
MNYILPFILILLLIIYMLTLKTNSERFNSNIENRAIIPLEQYPELNEIEKNKNIIIEELKNVIDKNVWILYKNLHEEKIISKDYNNEEINKLDSSINKYYLNSSKNPEWYVFGLIYNKNSTLSSKKFFSKTIKILENIKNITMAGISCLEAGGYIPPHNDEGIERYKYHVPLIIPENCGIKINGIDYNFEKPFLFDDTYIHSVWNNSDKPRFVLIVDILKNK